MRLEELTRRDVIEDEEPRAAGAVEARAHLGHHLLVPQPLDAADPTVGGERAQVELNMMRPPVKLQPDRTDLVERGITFSSVRCGGTAARNGTFTQLGEQFCCGLGHHDLVHC